MPEFQEGMAEQIVDFSPGNHGGTRGGDSASAPALHSITARGADYGFRSTANQGGARHSSCRRRRRNSRRCCQGLIHERNHDHIVDQSFPRSVGVGKWQKGKPGRDCEEELLASAMALAREEEDEFLQAVPQDEIMKEWQAKVFFSEESGDA